MSSKRSRKYVSQGFVGDLRQALSEFSRKTSAEHKAAVLFFLLCGVVLRAMLLGRPISIAEADPFMDFAIRPVGEIISDYSLPKNHVFHNLLTHLSTAVLGTGVVPLRLPDFLAGVLCLPLFYLFVRAMFNRYIALTTLAIVACSGPLIGVGALALGFGICWFCFTASLLLGRHFIKSNDLTSAMLIAVVNALGLWTMPSYCYAALSVFIWLFLSIAMAYTNSLRERSIRLVFAFIVFVGIAMLLYAPILNEHGLGHITDHHSHPRLDWHTFDLTHTDMAFSLWSLVEDATSGVIIFLGLTGLVYSAFVSSKLRVLLFSMFISGILLCLVLRRIEPPGVWSFTFFVFHLSSAIGLFYLLKFLQEKAFPNWGKGGRTFISSLIVALLFTWVGYGYWWPRTAGVPQADEVATFIEERLRPGDKFYVQHPWDAPIGFALRSTGADVGVLEGSPMEGRMVYVAVGDRPEQTVEGVLRNNEQDPALEVGMHMVQEWPGLKIFAAP